MFEDRIWIEGTKNENRQRYVPKLAEHEPLPFAYHVSGVGRVYRGEAPHVQYTHLREAVSELTDGKAGPYIFRHCYRLWLREAGVDEWRADRYFGHVTHELKRKYAGHEWDAFMAEDRERLIAYVEREWEAPKAVKKNVKMLKLA